MAQAPNPMETPGPPPPISKQTMHMCGILVDVYGLAELSPSARRISCLWLHHGRNRTREDMADIAARCVAAWTRKVASKAGSGGVAGPSPEPGSARKAQQQALQEQRGLIALAYDQRNHGSRVVLEMANGAWKAGNPTHAQDMFYSIAGTVADQMGLIDAVGAYLFLEDEVVGREGAEGWEEVKVTNVRREIDQHLVLGVSMGGHVVWQTMFLEPRITAGVVIVGCPDYMNLMTDRARLSKLPTYKQEDNGASFLGSKDFPTALIDACQRSDPKARIFFRGQVRQPAYTREEDFYYQQLQAAAGKKFLVCFGADDKMVPYRCSKPFLDWFKQTVRFWGLSPAIWLEDHVYPDTGHVFSVAMVQRAVQFVCEVVGGDLDERLKSGSVVISTSPEDSSSKI